MKIRCPSAARHGMSHSRLTTWHKVCHASTTPCKSRVSDVWPRGTTRKLTQCCTCPGAMVLGQVVRSRSSVLCTQAADGLFVYNSSAVCTLQQFWTGCQHDSCRQNLNSNCLRSFCFKCITYNTWYTKHAGSIHLAIMLAMATVIVTMAISKAITTVLL